MLLSSDNNLSRACLVTALWGFHLSWEEITYKRLHYQPIILKHVSIFHLKPPHLDSLHCLVPGLHDELLWGGLEPDIHEEHDISATAHQALSLSPQTGDAGGHQADTWHRSCQLSTHSISNVGMLPDCELNTCLLSLSTNQSISSSVHINRELAFSLK